MGMSFFNCKMLYQVSSPPICRVYYYSISTLTHTKSIGFSLRVLAVALKMCMVQVKNMRDMYGQFLNHSLSIVSS